jgi:hypothetical protein
MVLAAAETDLRLMHKIGAKNRNVLLEAGEHRLADTKRSQRLLVGTGEQVLIMRFGET